MPKENRRRLLTDLVIFLFVLGLTTAICLALARIDNDNNPFAMAMYILAVALIARFTDGYLWGVLASLVGTFCVNYIFTIPFWALNVTYPGYPLTVTVMLGVSLLISALTTRRYSSARISRLCTYAMLGVTKSRLESAPLPSAALLLAIKKNPSLTGSWKNSPVRVLSASGWQQYADPEDLAAWRLWSHACRLSLSYPFTRKI